MSQFKVSVDLSSVLQQAQGVVNAQVFPLLNQAVSAVAQATRNNWMESVNKAKLWVGEKDAYRDSIQWRMTGDFSAEVWTDYKLAEEIESGRPAKDLKKMLDTSLKVRISKKGHKYLYIPFRHNTPGQNAHAKGMPMAVYAQAKELSASRVVGKYLTPSLQTGKGHINIPRLKYKWGQSLNGDLGKRYAGMYRFDTSSGKQKSSSYLTFRTMSSASNGWIVGPRPGLNIAKGVADQMQPLAEQAFSAAVSKSV